MHYTFTLIVEADSLDVEKFNQQIRQVSIDLAEQAGSNVTMIRMLNETKTEESIRPVLHRVK